MTKHTHLLGTMTATILAATATADLQYGQAMVSAESNCFTGSDRAFDQTAIKPGDLLEATSSCGGGGTSASLQAEEAWFVLSAGSSMPGKGAPSDEKGGRPMIDGGNGPGAVEVEFTIDRPTLFRMSRCREGSTVRFWDGEYQIAELGHGDQVTQLREGTYWATLETDQYGTPMWAEIDWQQSANDDPADVNGDGRIDLQDLTDLVTILSDNGAKKPSPETGKDKNKGKGKGRGFGGATPMPKPKPVQKPAKGKGGDKPQKGEAPALDTRDTLVKGDLNQDGKVDIKDITHLLAKL